MDPLTHAFEIVVLVQWLLAVLCMIHALRAGAGRLYALLGFIPYIGFLFLALSLAKASSAETRVPINLAGSGTGPARVQYNCCKDGWVDCPAPSAYGHSGCPTCNGRRRVTCPGCHGANDPRRHL